MREWRWVVDSYMDAIKRKGREQAESKWSLSPSASPRYRHVFASEEEARDFVINRAKTALVDAKNELMKAERRLQKCISRFNKPRKGE